MDISQPSCLSIENDYAAIGSLHGDVAIYSLEARKVERSLQIGEPVTDAIWTGARIIFSTQKAAVKVYESGSEIASFTDHAGAVTALALHPGGDIVASVGMDKSFIFYDLSTLKRALRVYTDSCKLRYQMLWFMRLYPLMSFPSLALTACAFHPDGHLFAAGTSSGDIKIFSTKTGEQAAVFSIGASAAIQAISFSENGFWFAASARGQPSVSIFDLRKEGDAAKAKELETGEALSLTWDYSSQYLATAGPTGVTVQQYLKSSKAWSEPVRVSDPAVLVRWGAEAKTLVAVSKEGSLSVLGAAE
jgi:pre-mRNA-processing factor 19